MRASELQRGRAALDHVRSCLAEAGTEPDDEQWLRWLDGIGPDMAQAVSGWLARVLAYGRIRGRVDVLLDIATAGREALGRYSRAVDRDALDLVVRGG